MRRSSFHIHEAKHQKSDFKGNPKVIDESQGPKVTSATEEEEEKPTAVRHVIDFSKLQASPPRKKDSNIFKSVNL